MYTHMHNTVSAMIYKCNIHSQVLKADFREEGYQDQESKCQLNTSNIRILFLLNTLLKQASLGNKRKETIVLLPLCSSGRLLTPTC